MEVLSRMEIATDILEEARVLSDEYARDSIESVYNFLVDEEYGGYGIEESVCSYYNLTEELLKTFKKDAWLVVLLDGYEYLRYIDGTVSIEEEEMQILTELDNLRFTFTDLFNYFADENNKDKVKIIIEKYYEYVKKGNKFMKECRDYNFSHQTTFRNALTDYVDNIEAMDFICAIFEKLDDKYQSQINEELTGSGEISSDDEEFVEEEISVEEETELEDEEYQAAIDEMFEEDRMVVERIMSTFRDDLFVKVAGTLRGHFKEKHECDNFIGFFMSYVYQTLLDNQKNGKLFKEEKSLLEVLEKSNSNFKLLVDSFYSSSELVFVSLDVFAKKYYKMHMDVLEMRDNNTNSEESKRISMLDEHYDIVLPNIETKLVSSPLYELYDMVFVKYRTDYPNNYIGKLYDSLMGDASLEPVFYELNIEGDMNYHRLLMIRYFTRRFVEMIKIKRKSVRKEEMLAYIDLESTGFTLTSIVNNFGKNGLTILDGYEFVLKHTDTELKKHIRKLDRQVELKNMMKIDPLIISESTYYRALNDSDLYRYLESNGLEKTAQYLIGLSKENYKLACENIKELMISVYVASKEKDVLDSIEQTVALVCEVESSDVEFFVRTVLNDSTMLYQLLSKYYEAEKDEEFPINYTDRARKFPKIKQKLYPCSNE